MQGQDIHDNTEGVKNYLLVILLRPVDVLEFMVVLNGLQVTSLYQLVKSQLGVILQVIVEDFV